jgi:hypothetical protein
MLFETPVHPTGPTILPDSSISGIRAGCTCPTHSSTVNQQEAIEKAWFDPLRSTAQQWSKVNCSMTDAGKISE